MKKINPNLIFDIKTNHEFEDLAFKIFDYQIRKNDIYRKYSTLILKNKKPKKICEIPFLPISFFKSQKIISDKKQSQIIFKSSGTEGMRSSHHIADLNLYESVFKKIFISTYGNIESLCIIGLLPSYEENGDSSLIYMVDSLVKMTKNENSGFYNKDFEKLKSIIIKNESKKIKTIVLGVTYALLDFAKKFPMNLEHTTIIETGGMKGKRKELIKEEVHKILCSAFKLKNIHSEYGMTELLSQAYSKKDGVFQTPAWMKILIRDIYDPLSVTQNNSSGAINIIDLANVFSCPFIATNDTGVLISENMFKLNGRISNSDLRGCNLLVE